MESLRTEGGQEKLGPESAARWDKGQGGQGPRRTGKGTVPAELGARVAGSELPAEGWALAAEQAGRGQEVRPGDLGVCHRGAPGATQPLCLSLQASVPSAVGGTRSLLWKAEENV